MFLPRLVYFARNVKDANLKSLVVNFIETCKVPQLVDDFLKLKRVKRNVLLNPKAFSEDELDGLIADVWFLIFFLFNIAGQQR